MSWWQIGWKAIPGFLSLACLVLAWKYHILVRKWKYSSAPTIMIKEEMQICRGGVIGNIIFAIFMAALGMFNFTQ